MHNISVKQKFNVTKLQQSFFDLAHGAAVAGMAVSKGE